ncbi:MAG: hypothetical protein O2890_15395 [Cyanobacteria bacterium]|nr:hypothetical protein [Cyanobacteriota bacterium]MDA0867754.1 hypothetical protein [Cyanobacteriota bacterium]
MLHHLQSLFHHPSPPQANWRKMGARVFGLCTAGAALFTLGATLPAPEETALAETLRADLIINVPIVIPGQVIIVNPREAVEPPVTVQFVAQGDEWAVINLDGRTLFIAGNTRRNHTVTLDQGAYHLEITGANRFDVWDSGYLDVGRGDASVLVIRYSQTSGVQVAGDPYAWLPD